MNTEHIENIDKEEEMICLPKNRVQSLYAEIESNAKNNKKAGFHDYAARDEYQLELLKELFGSKCLPDEVGNEDNFASKESKPAEPKFKVGDKVRTMNVIPKQDIGRVGTVIINKDGLCNVRYNDNSGVWCDESDLEPYTEPACTYGRKSQCKNASMSTLDHEPVEYLRIASEESHLRNLSQKTANCDKHFDNIIKDSFQEHNRLHIAAMAMRGILANSDEIYRAETCAEAKQTPQAIAKYALACANALIAECERADKPKGE